MTLRASVYPRLVIVHNTPSHIGGIFSQTVEEIVACKEPSHGSFLLAITHVIIAQRALFKVGLCVYADLKDGLRAILTAP